jgi:hypothetical protein
MKKLTSIHPINLFIPFSITVALCFLQLSKHSIDTFSYVHLVTAIAYTILLTGARYLIHASKGSLPFHLYLSFILLMIFGSYISSNNATEGMITALTFGLIVAGVFIPTQPLPSKKQKTADALHFECAYIEMRNLLAYTFNVIAGEINDGVTPLDAGDEALKQRRELALNVVCKQTYNLNKSAHPITLEQHDALIEQFEHYLTLITCDDAPNEAFTDHHPTLNHLRYPDFEKEYELECELECEQFNRQSIDKNEEKQ